MFVLRKLNTTERFNHHTTHFNDRDDNTDF
jgi:hypothetical protein